MTTKKHTVHTDALDTLGTIIDETAARDAIHLAVEPVIAGERLTPGTRVVLYKGKAMPVANTRACTGIVDPFLPEAVKRGQRFWLVVNPRTITSLRHVWEHPDLPITPETVVPTNAEALREARRYTDAVAWMRAWAVERITKNYDGEPATPEYAYEQAMQMGHTGASGMYEGLQPTDEYWLAWETITGQKHDKDNEYFSCSC